jgi:hypothetical protein
MHPRCHKSNGIFKTSQLRFSRIKDGGASFSRSFIGQLGTLVRELF